MMNANCRKASAHSQFAVELPQWLGTVSGSAFVREIFIVSIAVCVAQMEAKWQVASHLHIFK